MLRCGDRETTSRASTGTRTPWDGGGPRSTLKYLAKPCAYFSSCENWSKCGCVASYVNDGLEWLVANYHQRTSVLASAAARWYTCTASFEGMVSNQVHTLLALFFTDAHETFDGT